MTRDNQTSIGISFEVKDKLVDAMLKAANRENFKNWDEAILFVISILEKATPQEPKKEQGPRAWGAL